jgi:hypothetical protein
MANSFLKDPNAVLDLTNGNGNTNWLASGETIASHVITPETGLTVDSSAETDTNTSVTVWLSGGTAGSPTGTHYTVACKIVTTDSRTDERTMTITVLER